MTNAAKAKGSQWERDVVKYFNDHGFPHVERRFGAGQQHDKGDLSGIQVLIECKNHKSINLSTIMDEVVAEKGHARMDIGLAVIKRRIVGPARAYAVFELQDAVKLLLDGGYGPK